ncbi:MAG: ABC transporter permease subunit [bacterium JZ-2024 1]
MVREEFLLLRWPWPRIVPEIFPPEIFHLPILICFSFLRMSVAYFLALFFAIWVGVMAGTSQQRANWLIPLLDILQSVPVLGFFPIAIFFFVSLTGMERVGMELASVFLIFTSMAWNMAFSVYESVRLLPGELNEVAEIFGLSLPVRFLKLYLPVCIPKLVVNSAMSWAGGWYFLVACEIISLGPVNIVLPGLGTFLSHSVQRGAIGLTLAGIFALILVILGMEIFVWRPMTYWAERYRLEMGPVEKTSPWGIWNFYRKNRYLRKVRALAVMWFTKFIFWVMGFPGVLMKFFRAKRLEILLFSWRLIWKGALISVGFLCGSYFVLLLWQPPPPLTLLIVPALFLSFLRIIIAFVLSLAWTIPLVLLAEGSPVLFRILKTIAGIGASLPATAFFPLFVFLFIRWQGGMNFASILLAMTGMQWYILFNLLAGVESFPRDLYETARAFFLPRRLYWKKILFPYLIPSLITGSISAWGGGWNALIISEYVVYQKRTYSVLGIGSLLNRATYELGNPNLILYVLLFMVLFLLSFNFLVWKRLYSAALKRYRVESG